MSAKYKLSKTDRENWIVNLKRFLAPVGVLYITSVIGVVGVEGHVLSLQDFIPNTFVRGGITLYFLNVALDVFLKWSDET